MTNLTARLESSNEDASDFAAEALDKLVIALTGVLALVTIFAFA